MDWIWIPAVALVCVFLLVLCCIFFKDYTCCPCRKERPPCRDYTTAALPGRSSDVEAPTLHPAFREPSSRDSSSRSFSLSIERETQPRSLPQPTVKPRAPPPPPPQRYRGQAPVRRPVHYSFDGNVKADNVVRMAGGVPTLDLHRLTVKEAVRTTDAFLRQSRRHNQHKRVRIITGRGLHSENGVPRIKPAIESLLSNENYKETAKGGCLDVQL